MLSIRKQANFAHAAFNLLFGGGQRNAHVMVRKEAEAAAGCNGNIAFMHQVKPELPRLAVWMLRISNIDQDIECPVRRIEIATMLLQQAYREITAAVIRVSHLAQACLRTG